MANNIDIIQLTKYDGTPFYPLVDINSVAGLSTRLNTIGYDISALQSGLSSAQSSITTLQGYFDANGKVNYANLPNLYIGNAQVQSSAQTAQAIGGLGALMPGTNGTYDLGSSSLGWKRGYFTGSMNVGGELYVYSDSYLRYVETDGLYDYGGITTESSLDVEGETYLRSGLYVGSNGEIKIYSQLDEQDNEDLLINNAHCIIFDGASLRSCSWYGDTIDCSRGGTGLTNFGESYRLLYSQNSLHLSTLAPNKTTTRKFLQMTGTGSAGSAPVWDTVSQQDVLGTSDIGSISLPVYYKGASNYALAPITDLDLLGQAASHGYVKAKRFYLSSDIYFEWIAPTSTTDGYVKLNAPLLTTGDQIVGSGTPGGGGGGGSIPFLTDLQDVIQGIQPTANKMLIWTSQGTNNAGTTGGWTLIDKSSVGVTTDATQSAHGLMSTADKIKLDSIKFGTQASDYIPITIGSTTKNVLTAHQSLAAYATQTWVNQQIDALPEPMVFKGSLGTGGTVTSLPAASSSNEGHTYKVITAGTYQSITAKVGDTFISTGSEWVLIPSGDEPNGTVTSVGLSVPTGLSVSGSPVTTSGTLGFTFGGSANQVALSNGSGGLTWTNQSSLSVGTASKLGSATVGSATKPIYLSSGTATECSTYAGGTAVTLNGTSKGATTASFYAPTGGGTANQVLIAGGNNTAPSWTNQSNLSVGTANKLGSATVGSTNLPIYLNAGTPTAITSFITDKLKEPVYVPDGATITSLPLVTTLSGNRLVLIPADQIIIEKTTDGGVTWEDAGVSDTNKVNLFLGTTVSGYVYIPRIDGKKNKLCGIRITITAMKYDVPSGTPETQKYNYWNSSYILSAERYVSLSSMYIYLGSGGSGSTIRTRVFRARGNSSNNWESADSAEPMYLVGNAGGNYIRLSGQVFGGGVTQTGNYWNYRIEFFSDGPNGGDIGQSSITSAQTIFRIQGFGYNRWNIPNNLVGINHLYTWDVNQNATFPGSINPKTNNSSNLGNADYRWANICGVIANFSGNTTIGGTLTVGTSSAKKATTLNGTLSVLELATLTGGAEIPSTATLKIGDATIEWIPNSGNGYLKIDKPLLTTGDQIVGSGTPSGGGGGGASYLSDLLDLSSTITDKPDGSGYGLVYSTSATDKNGSSGAWIYVAPGTAANISGANTTARLWSGSVIKSAIEAYGYVTTDNKVTQTATTTSSAYELLFSATADNTTRTEGARKTSTLTYNPSTKALSTGGAVNGLTLSAQTTGFKISGGTTSKTLTVGADYTLGAACAKGVTDNSSATAVTSSDTNLITARTLYYAGYVKSSGVTSITLTSGTGITVSDSGTAITGTGSRTISLNVAGAKTALGLGTMAYEAKADYVLLATAQTISAKHTFSNGILLNTASSWTSSDRAIAFSADGEDANIRYYNTDSNKGLTFNPNTGELKAAKFIKRGGTSDQFLKADGSTDSKTYLTSHQALYNLVINNSAGVAQITYKPGTSGTYSLTLAKTMVGLGNVDNLAASDYFTAITSTTSTPLSITVGGTTKTLSSLYATTAERPRSISGTAEAGGYNLNTILAGGGAIRNVSSSSYWAHAPQGLGYFGVAIQVNSTNLELGAMQFAYNMNYNGTTPTDKIWWRARNNDGWADDWHLIYDSATLTKSVITGLLGSTTYASYHPDGYLPLSGGTMTGSIKLPNGSYINAESGYTMLGIGSGGETFYCGPGAEITNAFNLRSGNINLTHVKAGTNYTIWDASNSNLSTVDWAANNLTVAGTSTFSDTMYVENRKYMQWKDSGGTSRNVFGLNNSNELLIGYGLSSVTGSTTALYGDTIRISASSMTELVKTGGGATLMFRGSALNNAPGTILFRGGTSDSNGFKIEAEPYGSYGRVSLSFYTSNVSSGDAPYTPDWKRSMRIYYNGNIHFGSDGAFYPTVYSYGPIVIGTTTNNANLTVRGTITSTGDQVISSDATLKTNWRELNYTVKDVANVKIGIFDWKDGHGASAGSVAQDWKKLIPELVHGDEGNMTLAYGQIALLNTVLLARRSEDHETRIKALELENAELRKEIKRLVYEHS